MADGNRSEASIAQHPQIMTSIPSGGGNPRYDRGPSMGYSGPPSHGSYGNAYSSYPPSYGNSMHGSYGNGQNPQGYPRGAYSMPPHSSAYVPGYGPGGYSHPPPPYPYAGYEAGPYGPAPPSGPLGAFRGASPTPPAGNATASSPPKSSASSPPKQSAVGSAETKTGSPQKQSPPTCIRPSLQDQGEVERLRAVAATEITTEEVKPIQTDFHFFVKDHLEDYRKLAQEEVRQSLPDSKELDPILVNSNLNARLMKAWESLTKEKRDAYMVQEEGDRRRFMEDDEIASRHCATLTARGKSQSAIGGSIKDSSQQRSPLEETTEPKNSEETKRPAPEAEGPTDDQDNETRESPSKKIKEEE